MHKLEGFKDVKENEEFKKMPAGSYVVELINVEEDEDKEYFKIEFDVAEGEWKGYARKQCENWGNWPYQFVAYASYKETALKMFKGFTSAFDKSYGTKFTEMAEAGDLRTVDLEDKKIGAILRVRHYVKNNGDLGEKLEIAKWIPISDVAKGATWKDAWDKEAEILANAQNELQGIGFDSMEKAESDNPFA